MKIKIAKLIADFWVKNGIEHVFTVIGEGAIHLNYAFGHEEGLTCVYNHHEQASAMAAEGYTRLTGDLAGVCVANGPCGTNAVTGVLGGWLDSIPMFIISGQVRSETTLRATEVPLRQLGDQEFNIIDCVKTMTKYAHMVVEPNEILYHLQKALYLCKEGRGGPVWLDIPLDVQAANVDTEDLKQFVADECPLDKAPVYDESLSKFVLEKITAAKRPVLLAGTGIRLGNAHAEFMELINKLQIPVVTAWNAHDILEADSPYFCGKPGTVGTRGGNFVVQNCDLLLVLGSRLNIRLISYNYRDFAKEAYKIIVDIDENELKKPTITPDLPIHANVKEVMTSLINQDYTADNENHKNWLDWAYKINQRYPAALPQYFENARPLNPYAFTDKLFNILEAGDTIVCGNGSACIITFQCCKIKCGQRLFTNSGCAAMGYGFPAAIGAAVAEKGKRVICIDGDGSFQMNLQELQTVVFNNLNIKIIYLNNNGYHSFRQTQTNLFGVFDESGMSFPAMKKISNAYGIPYIKIDSLDIVEEQLLNGLGTDGPVVIEVVTDPAQNFAPKLSSKVLPDGRIVYPPMDDMFPFLDREEYLMNKNLLTY